MSGLLTWGTSALGLALVVLVLRDIAGTLWQPSGRGRLTGTVMAGVWRLSRPLRRSGADPGPAAMLLVVLLWNVGIVVGWALVYLPHMPGSFSYGSSMDVSERSRVLDALYLSAVTVSTLGFGDIVPAAPWLRVAVPVHGLMGFVLLTAAVSWVLQVSPALARRRVLALRLWLLRRAQTDVGAGPASPGSGFPLENLAGALAQVRVDLSQNPETYYHRQGSDQPALPLMLEYALDLVDAAAGSDRADVRLGGAVLAASVSDFCDVLRADFGHRGPDDRAVLRQFAVEHGHHVGG